MNAIAKSSSKTNMNNELDRSTSGERHGSTFARSHWSHALALAEQLRHDTELKKNEQLRKYAFDIPAVDRREAIVITSVEAQADHVQSFQNELLFAKTGNFNLDKLSESFLDLKRTFNKMLELSNDDIKQVTLATSITKTALLMVFRTTECMLEILTEGTRKYPSLNSVIAYIRARHVELPVNGRLLVSWYEVAQVLDLLVNDPDWLVQPRKAHWAMRICNETMTWARAIFHANDHRHSTVRPIFDRDDSIIVPEPIV